MKVSRENGITQIVFDEHGPSMTESFMQLLSGPTPTHEPTNDPIAKLNADIEQLRNALIAIQYEQAIEVRELKIELEKLRAQVERLDNEVRNATANDA